MDTSSQTSALKHVAAKQGVVWRIAAGVLTAAIFVIAAAHAAGTESVWSNFLFDGGFQLAILVLFIATRATAPLVAGAAMALLAHQILVMVVLETGGMDGSLAAGIILVLTLPGGAFGAVTARVVQWRGQVVNVNLRAAMSFASVLGGMTLQLLAAHLLS